VSPAGKPEGDTQAEDQHSTDQCRADSVAHVSLDGEEKDEQQQIETLAGGEDDQTRQRGRLTRFT
jgi:hypothetical protein